MVMVPVAEYRPDVSMLNSAYTGDLQNVLWADGSLMPFPSLREYTEAITDTILGAFLARSLDGSVTVFAGTPEQLLVLNNTTLDWDDVSQDMVTYSANSDAPWSFTQFGPYVIAVNPNDDPQVFELGTSTEFADLGGSPPRAAMVTVWGDFVVLLRLTANPDRVQWSGLNDATSWTPGTDNSDYQTFPDGGRVQGATEATNPLVFQERAIRRGTFVPGSVAVFTFQKIHDKRGATSPRSIATRGSYAFFADSGGFFQISADGSIAPIGFEKVDRTIFQTVASSDLAKMRGVVDPFFSRVYWAVDVQGLGQFDTMLIYDFNLQKWSRAAADIVLHFSAATPGLTLEGLDDISASLDALPFSLDAKVWQNGAPVLGAFTQDGKLAFYAGASTEAVYTTQEMGDVAGTVTTVQEVTPIVDTLETMVSIGSRFRRNEGAAWTSEQTPSSNTGIVRKRSRGRFHRFRTRIPEGIDWTHAQGVEVRTIKSGQR